ncbi:MAG: RHS repeat-associated core domain-containing protein [Microscillaceae bacterium]|nr:RHS repeat-associated core domain-containing protein [Microscillaceae bacterium]
MEFPNSYLFFIFYDEYPDYLGGFIYEDDAPQFFSTAEGRVLAPGASPDNPSSYLYEYHYKDHLGNLRLSFSSGAQVVMQATMEPQLAVDEEHEFANIRQTREQGQALSGSFVAALEGTNRPIGPWKSIPLRKGDKIQVKAHARYEDKHKKDKDSNLGIFLQVAPGIRTQTDEFGQQSQSQEAPNQVQAGISLNPNRSKPKENIPNAYLKLQIYDKDDNFIGSEIRYISSLAAEGWEKLQLEYEAPQDGRIELFVANQSKQEVYFDDVIATSTEAMIVQENHYYPFGLNIVSLEKNGEPNHKFQYNGKEKQEEFGLNWYDYEARAMDIQLGRFHQIDPHAVTYDVISPYCYVANNPIKYIDPDGRDIYLNGDIKNVVRFLLELSTVSGHNFSYDPKDGKVGLYKSGDKKDKKKEYVSTLTPADESSPELNSLVYDLIEGDKKDKQVAFNLIGQGEKFQGLSSDETFFDSYDTGVFDVQDLIDLKDNEHRAPIVAGLFAHVLVERSVYDDYKGLIGDGHPDNEHNSFIYGQFLNGHLQANIFESSVVEDYYETNDGKPVKLEAAFTPTTPRKSGYLTTTISYGSSLGYQFSFDLSKRTTNNSEVIMRGNIRRKKQN